VRWDAAAHFTRYFAQRVLAALLPLDVDVLKIDVPADAEKDTPWRITRQARQSYYEVLPPSTLMAPGPLVELDYRIAVDWDTLGTDTDVYAFARDRVVAVTPLSQDLTSRTDLGELTRFLAR
jgi:broad specificity polyphosphatase/5'/3'-nucleotidase SurE